jgi:hypothetical protein
MMTPLAEFMRRLGRSLHLALSTFLVLLTLVALNGHARAQSVTFGTAKSYPAGQGPRSLAPCDLNGDGKVDLAVTNLNGNDVSVLSGNGDGTFKAAVNYPVGTRPMLITVGDFNRDDHLDVAVANNGSANVSVLIGNGDGTFKTAVNYGVGANPVAIIAGDFNHDGQLDLAATGGGAVSVLLGSGGGLFQSAVSYGVGVSPQYINTGDFNSDGKPDLVTANESSNNLSVLLNKGDGTFQLAINSNSGSGPASVSVGDYNRDGKPDAAVGTLTDPGAQIQLGKGDGTFGPPLKFKLDNTPTDIKSADFNGDGKLDLVSAGVFQGDNVQILLGAGDGTFQSAGSLVHSVGAVGVIVADFNGDTRPDIAAAVDSQVSVVLINATPGKPDNTQYFVHQHYLDFLDREPDDKGFDYWTNQIDRCISDPTCLRERRIGTSAAFFVETEFQQSGYFTYRLYRAAFGRRPSYAEFTTDRHKVIGGPELEASKTALTRAFTGRDAFKQAYADSLSKEDFVNKLFDTAGLTPFTAERAAAIASLNQGADRASVLQGLIDLAAFKQREYNPAFVQMQYFGYLRRDEDIKGYDFWLKVMNEQPDNYPRMVCAFITSAEYQLRFSDTITHTNAECGP